MATSKEDKIEMFRMSLDGITLREIGERYGITRERVRQILNAGGNRGRPIKCSAYPKLRDWLNANEYTLVEFARELGVGMNTMSMKLNGRRDFNMKEIRRVLKFTGMTFDEAFGAEVDPNEE